MANRLAVKEIFAKFYNRECLYSLAAALPALSLLLADVSEYALIPGILLWAAVLAYLGGRGRYVEGLTGFFVFWLYTGAEILTYNSISAHAFIAYATCTIGLAFALAGARQLASSAKARWTCATLGGSAVLAISFPALLCLCHFIIFKTVIPPDAFYAIGQTNGREAWEFFVQDIGVQWIFFLIVLAGCLIFLLGHKRKVPESVVPFSLISIILLLCFINAASTKDNLNLINKIRLYAVQYAEEMAQFKKTQAQKQKFGDIEATKTGSGETAILVIGEAQNKRHMGLYGYPRDTTPKLSALYQAGKIIRFDHAYSSHTHTMQTLSLALTQANLINNKRYLDSPTIIDITRAAGYETYWISNQALFGPWDNLVSIMANSADHLIALNRNVGKTAKTHNFDGATVPEIKHILETPTTKNRFIIVHLIGNHAPYCDRFPEAFGRFKDDLPAGEFGRLSAIKANVKNINCYDNSITYTDSVLADIIDAANESGGVSSVLYFSDHSEAVIGALGHNSSQFVYDMAHIPLFLWASDSYRQKYSAQYKGMKDAVGVLFSNENIYDTLIGLLDIKTKLFSPANDLSSDKYSAHKKPSYILYKEKEYASPENSFYWLQKTFRSLVEDGQSARIIPHRVNTLGKKADVYAAGYKSFELDLFYNKEEKRFDVGHDSKVMAGKTLDDFLMKAPEGGFEKVWLDIKNLNDENLEEVLVELRRLDSQYGLKKYGIVESGMAGAAFSTIGAAGFHTSYYLPSRIKKAIEAKDEAALAKAAGDIAAQVKTQGVKAVSFDVGLYPFVKEYLEPQLPQGVVYHTWDTKLNIDKEEFLKDIKAKPYYLDKRLETILVSFPSYFHL